MKSRDVRKQFIDFFAQKHGHSFVASSPVVPHDDPTLLFTNAGMNQFKPYFLGTAKAPWTRVANTQKCIRAGGKHNDLDDVGRSRRHHTFFEMLGNWSFGDYFKQGAIAMAWELLTQVWKLDPKRLHVTVYKGNPADGVPPDDEAARLWQQIAGMPDDHIHRFVDDNFWEMGETGPCGPCTEIFIDRTPDCTGGPQVNGTDPRVMEIWNLVFIQYNRGSDRKLTPLPAQHVDTGMGLERICQVLGGYGDNYATDLFTPIFDAIGDICGKKYAGLFPDKDQKQEDAETNPNLARDIGFRVIADHLRCLTFALTDGAMPGNDGRGYVLRRILRRAVRFGRQNLGVTDPFLHKLTPVIVDIMGDAFPELKKNPARVAEIIHDEEQSFGRTLDRGLELFKLAAAEARATGKVPPMVSAANAFKLHDTYGFPIDLTQVMAREQHLEVDAAGYETLMEEAREKARSAGKTSQDNLADLPPDILAELARLHVSGTNDTAKYQHKAIRSDVAAIWDGGRLVGSLADAGSSAAVILRQTNFYAEMGGQVGDTGELHADHGGCFEVRETRSVGGYVLHLGILRSGKLNTGDTVSAEVHGARHRIENNHTGTHLANWALRAVLGEHVEQKGSLVDAEKLRFDFVQPKALTDAQIAEVEALVNKSIAADLPVYSQVVPLEEGRKIKSLRAVFGEKYPPQVRVVSVGAPVTELLAQPDDARWMNYSIEFCGGTHVASTKAIENFALVAEESVSKGIRRIVALTGAAGKKAADLAGRMDSLITQSAAADAAGLPAAIAAIQSLAREPHLPMLQRRKGQHAVAQLQQRLKDQHKKAGGTTGGPAAAEIERLLGAIEHVNGTALLVSSLPEASADVLRSAMDAIKKKHTQTPLAILLAGVSVDHDKDGNPLPAKVNLLAAVSDALVGKLAAGDWVKAIAPMVGGSGGGRPQMAMAGGKDTGKVAEALAAGRELAQNKLA